MLENLCWTFSGSKNKIDDKISAFRCDTHFSRLLFTFIVNLSVITSNVLKRNEQPPLRWYQLKGTLNCNYHMKESLRFYKKICARNVNELGDDWKSLKRFFWRWKGLEFFSAFNWNHWNSIWINSIEGMRDVFHLNIYDAFSEESIRFWNEFKLVHELQYCKQKCIPGALIEIP